MDSCTDVTDGYLNVTIFTSFLPPDVDSSGYINACELGSLFREVGIAMPGYKVREIITNMDCDKNGKISFDEFIRVGNTN